MLRFYYKNHTNRSANLKKNGKKRYPRHYPRPRHETLDPALYPLCSTKR